MVFLGVGALLKKNCHLNPWHSPFHVPKDKKRPYSSSLQLQATGKLIASARKSNKDSSVFMSVCAPPKQGRAEPKTSESNFTFNSPLAASVRAELDRRTAPVESQTPNLQLAQPQTAWNPLQSHSARPWPLRVFSVWALTFQHGDINKSGRG